MCTEVLNSIYSFAFGTKLIFRSLLAFFKKMFVKICYFNYLTAFPALCKHRALFPVMNIERFLIESFVKTSTESAGLFIISLILLVLLILIAFRPHSLLVWGWVLDFCTSSLSRHGLFLIHLGVIFIILRRSTNSWLLCSPTASLSSMRINICHNSFFWSCSSLFRLLDSICSINFRKCCFKLL